MSIHYKDIITEEMIYGFIKTLKRYRMTDPEIDSVMSDYQKLDYFPKMLMNIPREIKNPDLIRAVVMSMNMNFGVYSKLIRK
ncbi:hypothetical protein [Ruminobacter sp.]|uniref:hypothetical protein n=1 Tax=Ruminobacter sp. TaxID=2774296 RepID=UPI00386AC0BD